MLSSPGSSRRAVAPAHPQESFIMRKTLIALAAAAGLALPATVASAQDAGKAPLVTVVTAESPQTQLMAMVLTSQAVNQGHSVEMLLCGTAGDIALSDAPESATAGQPPRDASPQGLMRAIIEAGGDVKVCAIYLPGKGLGQDALIEGVGVAQPPAMAAALLAEGTRVWSF
jgi:predicted peroxiredoxin